MSDILILPGTHWVDKDRTVRAIVQSVSEQFVTIETGKLGKVETITMSREEFLRDHWECCITKDYV